MSSMFDSELEAIARQKKKVNDSAGESDDVKNGTVTKDEELKEPSYVLFNSMMDTITKIMSKEEVSKSMCNILNAMTNQSISSDKSAAFKELINLMIMIITTSSYEAILCYDDMLKEELTTQFDNIVKYFNEMRSEVSAHNGTLNVFKKQLSEIDKKIKIDEVRKQVNQ